MRRFWRWLKSHSWIRGRKQLAGLIAQNDYLQQRVLHLEESHSKIRDLLTGRKVQLNKYAELMATQIKSIRSELDEALMLMEQQERQIDAQKELLRIEEQKVKSLVAGNEVVHQRWKSQVMIEGARQAAASASTKEDVE